MVNINKKRFLESLEKSQEGAFPYSHWILKNPLTEAVLSKLTKLPFKPAQIDEYGGRRELNNSSRLFLNKEACAEYHVCRDIVEVFGDTEVRDVLQKKFKTPIEGTHLRIEYCQDKEGFWLEPHTDVGEKMFTFLIYLGDENYQENWGTDVYDSDKNHIEAAPFKPNNGLIFIPAEDTWHGFEKKPIKGVRKTLIINYVTDAWRARHELYS